MSQARSRSASGQWHLAIPALVCLGALVCLLTWMNLSQAQKTYLQNKANRTAIQAANALAVDLALSARAAARMAKAWPQPARLQWPEFQRHASALLRDLPGARAIALLAPDGSLRYVAHVRRNPPLSSDRRLQDFLGQTQMIENFRRARTSGQVRLADTGAAPPGDVTMFALFVPLQSVGQSGGAIALVFDVDSWMRGLENSPALAPLRAGYRFALAFAQGGAYRSPDWGTGPAAAEAVTTRRILGHPVTVGVQRISSAIPPLFRVLPEVLTGLLAIFLSVSCLLLHVALCAHAAKRANAELLDAVRSTNAKLTAEVSERRKAERDALAASDLKSRFLANMSHEIRTPVNAITGMFELIGRADVPERQKRQARVGCDAAERLFAMLENVLELSQLEAKTLTYNPQVVSVATLVEKWEIALDAMISKAGRPLTAHVDLAGDTPAQVFVDPRRMDQIVTNLLDNAVKYTPEGAITLRLRRAEAGQSEGPGVIIDVSDTGSGIPDTEKRAVFERFRRTKTGRAQFEGGVGLGLNIVLELVTLMNLKLDLRDTPGGGTTFSVELPCPAEAAAAAPVPEGPPSPRELHLPPCPARESRHTVRGSTARSAESAGSPTHRYSGSAAPRCE